MSRFQNSGTLESLLTVPRSVALVIFVFTYSGFTQAQTVLKPNPQKGTALKRTSGDPYFSPRQVSQSKSNSKNKESNFVPPTLSSSQSRPERN